MNINVLTIENRLADEMLGIVCAAAGVPQGKPAGVLKAQIMRAWNRLGQPDFWRVEDAFKGRQGRAGRWIGVHHEEFRIRDAARRAREARESVAAGETIAALRQIRDAYAITDPEFHEPAILALEQAIRLAGGDAGNLGNEDRAMDQAGGAGK